MSDIDDDEEITLDKSLDITQDDTSTFKLDSPNGSSYEIYEPCFLLILNVWFLMFVKKSYIIKNFV